MIGFIRLALIACIVWAGSAQAAPSISGTSGTWSHGGSVTVNGSSFGSKSPAAPRLWDDGTAANMTAAGWSGGWPNAGPSGSQIGYSTGIAGVVMPHSRISKYLTGAHEGTGGSNAGYNVIAWIGITRSEGMGIYANYYHRVNPSWQALIGSPQDGNFKTIDYSLGSSPYDASNWYLAAFFDDPPTDAQYIITDDGNSLQNPDANGDNAFHETMVSPAKGLASDASKWVKNEFEMVVTNQLGFAGNGKVRMWDNGVLGVNYAGRTDSYSGTSRVFGIGGYSRDYGTSNNRRYWAGIYIDTTLSRVVLCSGSTYASRGICEPQIPTSWSASSIGVTVNAGRFADASTAYLYVCDSANSCNSSGTTIVIAAGGGSPAALAGSPAAVTTAIGQITTAIRTVGGSAASVSVVGTLNNPSSAQLQGTVSANSIVGGSVYIPLPAPATFERRAR